MGNGGAQPWRAVAIAFLFAHDWFRVSKPARSGQGVKENLLGAILQKSLGLPLLFCFGSRLSKDTILELLQPSSCDHWGM